MGWLWLLGVGYTDVQFLLHGRDRYGQLVHSRLDLDGRGAPANMSLREQHLALAELAKAKCLRYPEEPLPRPARGQGTIPEGLNFERDGDSAVTSCELDQPPGLGYRLHPEHDRLTFPEMQLDIFCPKAQPLLPPILGDLGAAGLQPAQGVVLVLNTWRDNEPEEPLAAGPVVAQFLAQRLGLRWNPEFARGDALSCGETVWVNVLRGEETIESSAEQVIQRINAALCAAAQCIASPVRVYVTPAGGLPKLKPLLPILAAQHFGRDRVCLVEEPERNKTRRPVSCLPMGTTLLEHQALRLQAVEQIDRGAWHAAYGVAGAALITMPDAEWALTLQRLVATILDLPGRAARGSVNVNATSRLALQVEMAWTEGSVRHAVMLTGAFLERFVRDAAHKRVLGAGLLTWNDTDEIYLRPKHVSATTVENRFQDLVIQLGRGRSYRLSTSAGALLEWADELGDYPMRHIVQGYIPLAHHRNAAAHGDHFDAAKALADFMSAGLISTCRGPFGTNFVGTARFAALLDRNDFKDIPMMVKKICDFDRSFRTGH